MNNIIKRVWIQNRLVNIEDLTGMVFQAEIGAHTFEISGIDDTGAAVALSGTVSGVFRRPDNADIALTGAASGGVVSVTLPADCYAVPGRFGLTIFVTSNSQKVAVYACVGTVAVSSTGNVAGDTPANVEDLLDAIDAAIADLNTAIGSIPADYSQFMAAIAPAYSSSALYAVGSYAWHDGTLYRCTTPITTAEAWTAAHWTAAVLGDDVSDLKSHLEQTVEGLLMYQISFDTQYGQVHPSTKIIDCDIKSGTPYYIKISAENGTMLAPKVFFSDESEVAKAIQSANTTVTYIDDKDVTGFGFYGASSNPSGKVKIWVYIEESALNAVNQIKNVQNNLDKISNIYNYYNYADANDNNYLNSSGYLTEHNSYCATNFIPVKSGDIVYAQYFGVSTPTFSHVCRYTKDKVFIDRIALTGTNYNSNFDGFVRFNVAKGGTYLLNHLYCISLNDSDIDMEHKYGLVGIKEKADYAIQLSKIDANNYVIRFGDFSVVLFYTDNTSSNSHNWNIKRIRHGENVLVPDGTDIIGPIKINTNNDFIGGVHGDETTNNVTVAVGGASYALANVTELFGDTLTITFDSTVYDQENPTTAMFKRIIIIVFEKNKMTVSNTFVALASCTLKRATNGGLIAAANPIITSAAINSNYYPEAPESGTSAKSRKNTTATINTIYGSMTVRNIIGHEMENYEGYIQVFSNESPKRTKIYFDTYKEGTYSISVGDMITGTFEYIFS